MINGTPKFVEQCPLEGLLEEISKHVDHRTVAYLHLSLIDLVSYVKIFDVETASL